MTPSQNDGTGREMIARAFEVASAVSLLREHARTFYYEVLLSGRVCLKCGSAVVILRDGQCRCRACDVVFDPTIAFQRCLRCGGTPRIRIRRYECISCGEEIVSSFLFDGLVFDADYFRQKVAEHRQRESERREHVRLLLADSRSPVLEDLEIDEMAAGDLFAAVDAALSIRSGEPPWEPREAFDLKRYEMHIKVFLGTIERPFERIPPLSDDALLDRVWRFIAIVFLAHAGGVRLRQAGATIWVIPHEADGKRQGISGDVAAADRVEGLAS